MNLKLGGEAVVLVLTIPNFSLQPQGIQKPPCINIKCAKTQPQVSLNCTMQI